MPLLMLLSLPNIPFCLTLCMKTFMTATVNYTVSTALCIYYYLAFNKLLSYQMTMEDSLFILISQYLVLMRYPLFCDLT